MAETDRSSQTAFCPWCKAYDPGTPVLCNSCGAPWLQSDEISDAPVQQVERSTDIQPAPRSPSSFPIKPIIFFIVGIALLASGHGFGLFFLIFGLVKIGGAVTGTGCGRRHALG